MSWCCFVVCYLERILYVCGLEILNKSKMKKKEIKLVDAEPMDVLYQDARQIIETARSNAVRSVDFCRV